MPSHRGGTPPSFGPWCVQRRPDRRPPPSGLGSHLAIYLAWGATHTSSVTEVAEWVQTLAPPDTTPPPTLTPVLPPLLVTPPPTLPSPSSQPPQSPPSSPPLLRFGPHHYPPCVLPCPRRLKPRRGRAAALLLLRYSRAAWQGVDACG